MAAAACLNILTMDGGGVRGISSLLILQDLMKYINKEIGESQTPITPQDIFYFAAGTSTGGLIAIMLGKLGMSPEECIQAYQDLSKKIFGQKKHGGRITRGLAQPKYSGKNLKKHIRNLMRDRAFEIPLPIFSKANDDRMGCAVICREFSENSEYSNLIPEPVPICSLQCPQQIECCTSEAARATSAAPTYFPIEEINGRIFADGGMEYNNPSQVIFEHYFEDAFVAASYKDADMSFGRLALAHQCDQDFQTVRIINLGTGTKPKELPTPKREKVAKFFFRAFRMGRWLKQTLTDFAVDSEKVARSMKTMAIVSSGRLKYERFSADNGVCFIKMDKYKDLPEIQRLTEDYLGEKSVIEELERVAKDIAEGFIQQRDLTNQEAKGQ